MKNWYCIIKGQGDYGWSPLIKDCIKAASKAEARKIIETELKKELPMRYKKENVKLDSLLLQLYEHKANYFTVDFFDEKECGTCGKTFRMVDKFNLTGSWGNEETCSPKCKQENYEKWLSEHRDSYENWNYTKPVIYKITQISTGKVYIGKTIRSYTLRWWEHIKSKEWICEDPVDVQYQLLEVLPKDTKEEEILKRESYYIKKYNSIENGFNLVISKKENK